MISTGLASDVILFIIHTGLASVQLSAVLSFPFLLIERQMRQNHVYK